MRFFWRGHFQWKWPAARDIINVSCSITVCPFQWKWLAARGIINVSYSITVCPLIFNLSWLYSLHKELLCALIWSCRCITFQFDARVGKCSQTHVGVGQAERQCSSRPLERHTLDQTVFFSYTGGWAPPHTIIIIYYYKVFI